MRSERWSTNCERMKVLKVGAAGPVLQFENGECWSFDGEGHVMILGVKMMWQRFAQVWLHQWGLFC